MTLEEGELCPQCEKGKLSVITKNITLTYRGRTREFKKAIVFKCNVCDYEASPAVNDAWQRYCGQIDYYEGYEDFLRKRVFEKHDDVITISKNALEKGIQAFVLFHEVGLAKSRSAARRLIRYGGAYVNSIRLEKDEVLTIKHAIANEMILQSGKKCIKKIIVK